MRTIAAYLPAIACGGMMLLVCVPMMLSHKRHTANDQNASPQDIRELREEIAFLKAERALEGKSEASLNG